MFLLLIILAFVIYSIAKQEQVSPGSVLHNPSIEKPSNQMQNISVYFCGVDNCSMILESQISNSKKADCAFYELTRKNIVSALDNASARVVIDRDERKKENNKSYVKTAKNSALMHNKFCVLDNVISLTGSFNPTLNDGDENNVVIFDSGEIASHYQVEFNELWEHQNNQPSAKNQFGNVEIYFCPEDNCADQVILELKSAKSSINFMIFSFTHTQIGTEIVLKYHEGIKIAGLMEKSQSSNFSRYSLFKEQGMNVSWDGSKDLLHHKVFIIDNETVITGSFNPSNNADKRNDENLVIIHDNQIASKFQLEFERLFAESLKAN